MSISKSPQKGTFQKEAHIKNAEAEGKEPNEAYLNMFAEWQEEDARREQDPAWQKDNMEYDLRTTEWILEKVRVSESYAQNLYAVMCNNEFIKKEMWPILKDQRWGCSWRHAGGVVADMIGKGDYIDWYCSGIRNDGYQDDLATAYPNGYVSEGVVTDEIRSDLERLGWIVTPYKDDYDI
jgi:hypothetical protein